VIAGRSPRIPKTSAWAVVSRDLMQLRPLAGMGCLEILLEVSFRFHSYKG
jgi:hypothetical protein